MSLESFRADPDGAGRLRGEAPIAPGDVLPGAGAPGFPSREHGGEDRPRDLLAVRRTIGATDNPAVLGGMKAKNNGRYNGDGRTWMTPPEVFDPLHAEFGFTLDPCANEKNNLGLPATFTEKENGLEQSWAGHRVFMNPPYGREVYAWTQKAREEAARGALVVGLLPASTDLAWWHDDVKGHAREVRWIRGRVRFLTDGPYRASGFFASCIVIWGNGCGPRCPVGPGCRGCPC